MITNIKHNHTATRKGLGAISVHDLWLLAEIGGDLRTVPLNLLTRQLSHNCWFGRAEIVTPIMVMQHAERVYAADLAYPLIVRMNQGVYDILDGIHRLVKHRLQGSTSCQILCLRREQLRGIAYRSIKVIEAGCRFCP